MRCWAISRGRVARVAGVVVVGRLGEERGSINCSPGPIST